MNKTFQFFLLLLSILLVQTLANPVFNQVQQSLPSRRNKRIQPRRRRRNQIRQRMPQNVYSLNSHNLCW